MKRYLELIFVSLVSVSVTLYVTKQSNKTIDGGTPDSFSLFTSSATESWKEEIKASFNYAEQEIYKIKPKPDIVGPHEDPDKCICKGSGIIRQGDGHTTPCPYHSKKFVKPLIILEK